MLHLGKALVGASRKMGLASLWQPTLRCLILYVFLPVLSCGS